MVPDIGCTYTNESGNSRSLEFQMLVMIIGIRYRSVSNYSWEVELNKRNPIVEMLVSDPYYIICSPCTKILIIDKRDGKLRMHGRLRTVACVVLRCLVVGSLACTVRSTERGQISMKSCNAQHRNGWDNVITSSE
jgi:hypothetical protein